MFKAVFSMDDQSQLAASAAWQNEQRTGPRSTKVLRIARLSASTGEALAIVRNISDHGMMVEIHAQVDLGHTVSVDLGDGRPLRGEVRWREGTSAGLHFAEPLDRERILGKPATDWNGRVARLPRVRTAHSAQLLREHRRIHIEICDISVGGARVRCDDWLEAGEQVSLLIPGLEPLPGAVRWQAEGSAGIAFHRAASIHALMDWLADSQPDGGSTRAGPAADSTTLPQAEPCHCDQLTGLPDRRAFLAQLDACIAGHHRGARALVLGVLDLDGFKLVNDVHGHASGDAILVETARRLATAIGPTGIVARLGDDEFAFLLTEAPDFPDRLSALASLLAGPIATPSGCPDVSACIGLATFPRDASDGPHLIRHADIALAAAQQGGANRIEHFHRDMLDCLNRRARLHERFTAGLLAGEFAVHYEPIVALAGGCSLKVEALFRWNHPERGLLRAGQFSDVFAEAALTTQIGQFVLEQVIAQLGEWRAIGVPIGAVTVNATLADFRNPQFVDTVLGAIAAGQVANDEICIEITEDVLIDDALHCARHEIERLHQAGVCLIFDDFGTGYASLRHLRDMPICAVKIDRGFVAAIATNAIDRGLVKSIIDIAHLLGRVVVAEGVETAEQAAILGEMGCDMVQGYLVSAALPPAEIAAWTQQFAAMPPVASLAKATS